MADEATNAAPAGEAPAEGSAEGEGAAGTPKKKKMLLIVSSAAAVLGILVAVGVFFFMGGEKTEEHSEEDAATHMEPVAIYDVPEFSLSLLSDDPNAQHYIKMKISVELAKAGDAPNMDKLLPRLQDDWGGFLRQMRVSDLQGSANLQRLKESLLRRANQSLEPLEVKAVYIKDLLIQ